MALMIAHKEDRNLDQFSVYGSVYAIGARGELVPQPPNALRQLLLSKFPYFKEIDDGRPQPAPALVKFQAELAAAGELYITEPTLKNEATLRRALDNLVAAATGKLSPPLELNVPAAAVVPDENDLPDDLARDGAPGAALPEDMAQWPHKELLAAVLAAGFLEKKLVYQMPTKELARRLKEHQEAEAKAPAAAPAPAPAETPAS